MPRKKPRCIRNRYRFTREDAIKGYRAAYQKWWFTNRVRKHYRKGGADGPPT